MVTDNTVGMAIGMPPIRRTSKLSTPVRYFLCCIGNMTRISTSIPSVIEQMQKFPIAFRTYSFNVMHDFCKVDVPSSNTTITWTPVFEWYVVRCRSKNGHQKTCV